MLIKEQKNRLLLTLPHFKERENGDLKLSGLNIDSLPNFRFSSLSFWIFPMTTMFKWTKVIKINRFNCQDVHGETCFSRENFYELTRLPIFWALY